MKWLTKYDNIPEAERIRRIAELVVTAIERHARLQRSDPSAVKKPAAAPAVPVDAAQLVSDASEQRMIAYLGRVGAATPRDFHVALGLSPMTVTRRLARLRSAGLLSVEGHTRSARYVLRTEFEAN